MQKSDFILILQSTASQLEQEAKTKKFTNSKSFETRTREIIASELSKRNSELEVNFNSHAQEFPDICLGKYGVEVKFTEKDTWSGVANSISQGMKDNTVEEVYILWGKMGGEPSVKFRPYEEVVYHVRTSHVPRFEINMNATESFFSKFDIPYPEFNTLSIDEKMDMVRRYVRKKLASGTHQHYWHLESQHIDSDNVTSVKFFNDLDDNLKLRLVIEEMLLFPQIISPTATQSELDLRILHFFHKHRVLYPSDYSLFISYGVHISDSSSIRRFVKDNHSAIESVLSNLSLHYLRLYSNWGKKKHDITVSKWLEYVERSVL